MEVDSFTGLTALAIVINLGFASIFSLGLKGITSVVLYEEVVFVNNMYELIAYVRKRYDLQMVGKAPGMTFKRVSGIEENRIPNFLSIIFHHSQNCSCDECMHDSSITHIILLSHFP